jgi:hypothetical protein
LFFLFKTPCKICKFVMASLLLKILGKRRSAD